jgi:hypothetical protein
VRCLGAAVLAALVMSIFLNGTIGITLAQANAMGALRHVWRVMFTRWGQELLLVGELQASTHHAYQLVIIKRIVGYYGFFHEEEPQEGEEDREVSSWVTLRARWVTLRARWVTLRARWVTLRARWVTLRARWVTLRARWVTLRARWVTLRASSHLDRTRQTQQPRWRRWSSGAA